MNSARLAVMLVGFGLVLMAALVAYYQTDLRNQMPEGVAMAILLLLVGLMVIAFSSELRRSRHVATHGVGYGNRPVVERIEREHIEHSPGLGAGRYDDARRYDAPRDSSVERVDRETVYRR